MTCKDTPKSHTKLPVSLKTFPRLLYTQDILSIRRQITQCPWEFLQWHGHIAQPR